MKRMNKVLSVLVCLVLLFALGLSGCGSTAAPETTAAATAPVETTTAAQTGSTENAQESNVLGEGSTVFTLTVTDLDGKETSFEIHTDKETVGEALLDAGLIAGEEGQYGLYVITLDWDKDGKYWAFYIDGEYATTSLDLTDITPGAAYSLIAE